MEFVPLVIKEKGACVDISRGSNAWRPSLDTGHPVAMETPSKGKVLRVIQAVNRAKLMRLGLRADSNRIKRESNW